MPRADRAAGGGFTLIETLVALVILSAVLMGFYELLSTVLNSARHVGDASIAFDRKANELELAAALNPMAYPQGSFELGRYRIAWTSRPLTAPRESTAFFEGAGPFTVALYDVQLTAPVETGNESTEVTVLGYHRDAPLPNYLGAAGQ
jgi:prepilin-type N-terminal cleavage/methylation domain-containing protein